MIYEHFKKTLIFIGRTTTKKGQGMPCPYLGYVSTFGYRYVAFNFYWFYASRVYQLSITNDQLSINTVHCSLIIEH
jgi:hypothetical protein